MGPDLPALYSLEPLSQCVVNPDAMSRTLQYVMPAALKPASRWRGGGAGFLPKHCGNDDKRLNLCIIPPDQTGRCWSRSEHEE
jgi:hypothetical protein